MLDHRVVHAMLDHRIVHAMLDHRIVHVGVAILQVGDVKVLDLGSDD